MGIESTQNRKALGQLWVRQRHPCVQGRREGRGVTSLRANEEGREGGRGHQREMEKRTVGRGQLGVGGHHSPREGATGGKKREEGTGGEERPSHQRKKEGGTVGKESGLITTPPFAG